MSNTNSPFGLRPYVGNVGGSGSNFSLIEREIAYGDTTAIYTGDPVKQLSTGYISQWTATTAASQLVGIFAGVKYYNAALGRTVWLPYWPGVAVASTVKVYAQIIPTLFAGTPTFVVQTDSTGYTIADIGANADITLGSGNTSTGRSGAYLAPSATTTATLPFRIIGLWSDVAAPGAPGTDTGGYNWVIVAANVTGTTGI